jgi:hypothetical protein
MNKYSETAQAILLRILEFSQDSAPVVVSFGYVKENHCHKGLVIKSAPSSVIKAIINDERVFCAHLETDGLHITPQQW